MTAGNENFLLCNLCEPLSDLSVKKSSIAEKVAEKHADVREVLN